MTVSAITQLRVQIHFHWPYIHVATDANIGNNTVFKDVFKAIEFAMQKPAEVRKKKLAADSSLLDCS